MPSPYLFQPDFKFDFNQENQPHRLSAVKLTQEQVYQSVQKAFAADMEGKIRKALIDMGWTPPADKDKGEA